MAASQAADASWWTQFGDATLTALVEEAVGANHDVKIAVERVRAARAGLDAQRSRLLPTLGLQSSASQSNSGLPDAVKQGQPDTRAYRVGIDLAWEIDIAGGARAARNAAQADTQMAEAAVAGARLLLSSEVARQYFVLRGAQQRLRIVESLAAAQRGTARLVASRQREGVASQFDLSRANAEADALAAQSPALRTLVGTTQNNLAVLLGRDPSRGEPVVASTFAWPAGREIAAGQPSDLLRRRPDLMAAESRYAAESLRTAKARAQVWPKVFLSALLGREDLRLNALNLAPVRYSNVVLAFAMPLFNAGRIDAVIQSQSARASEAQLAWQKAVLVAVREVEDSLLARSQEAERASALQAALAGQREALHHAESLRREGQIDLLILLDVQRSVLSAELALADSQTQRALDDVKLYKALGGGWSPAQPQAGLAQNAIASIHPAEPVVADRRTEKTGADKDEFHAAMLTHPAKTAPVGGRNDTLGRGSEVRYQRIDEDTNLRRQASVARVQRVSFDLLSFEVGQNADQRSLGDRLGSLEVR